MTGIKIPSLTGCTHRWLCEAVSALIKSGAQLWAKESIHCLSYNTKEVIPIWREWWTRAPERDGQLQRGGYEPGSYPKCIKPTVIQFCNGSMSSSQDHRGQISQSLHQLTTQYHPHHTVGILYAHTCSNPHFWNPKCCFWEIFTFFSTLPLSFKALQQLKWISWEMACWRRPHTA